jgi:holo-[acyl-carrier protein] synthase
MTLAWPLGLTFTNQSPPAFIAGRTHLGFDLVQISAVRRSLEQFGPAFQRRLFTRSESDYCGDVSLGGAERLAARFAAKEAVIKALNLGNEGINWRDIEVVKQPDGACTLALHGKVSQLAASMGVSGLLLSLSHDGDYAGAVVIALFCVPPGHALQNQSEGQSEGGRCGTV